MCGICGIVEASGRRVDAALLARMSESLRHRGPDDSGCWCSADGRIGLAHRRLAIIDLSPGGHQPMSDESGQVWVTFNGEIYNYRDLREDLRGRGHRFLTASDTEVLLAAYRQWGVDCLGRLDGMFAFAIYDGTARHLFLARDRAGEKPLFVHHSAGRLTFASELKALMTDPAFPRRLSPPALDHYLAYGYVPGDLCILAGVRKLPPAHALIYDLGADDLRVRRYWSLPEGPPPDHANVRALTDELEALLLDSVRRQLVADVPVGVLLSGGIDSSLVTAAAARVSSSPPKTFTVTFPGHAAFDEGPFARQVARHFGTEHTELAAEPVAVSLLPDLVRQYDEPLADSSMLPTFLVARVIRAHATVALAGDGGDELFGGYPHYGWIQQQAPFRKLVPRPLRAAAGRAAALLPLGFRGRNHALGLAGDTRCGIAHINLYFDARTRRRLSPLLAGARESDSPEQYKEALCRTQDSALRQATSVDFATYLPDDLLVKVDRASMLTSLEVRAPWLDHHLVEFAFSRVPDSMRATARQRKVLPRLLAQRLLPAGLDLTRKQGFSLPLESWFRQGWGDFVADVLGQADGAVFNRRALAAILRAQRRGWANTQRLYAVTFFELWRREYRVTP